MKKGMRLASEWDEIVKLDIQREREYNGCKN
jgi:hypothetical protein